ncbi:MAG: hypothetical protein JXB88_16825 [Spirochaetales bacterium]|nr:hypothetical protein [Spirochaetales bacterium]
MIKKIKEVEEEISKKEAFKAVYEYETRGALFHAIRLSIYRFFRFLLDILHSIFS